MNGSAVIATNIWSTEAPMTANNMSHFQFEPSPIFFATTAIFFLLIVGIILGNAMVLFTTWLDKRLHQPNKYFIACLATADLFVGIFTVPIRLHMQFNLMKRHPIELCRFWIWMDTFCEVASIATLTMISVDRYFKISQPFKYRVRMDTKIAAIIITNIWLLASVAATFALMPFDGSGGVSSVVSRGCISDNRIYYTILSVAFFFVPSVTIIVMYALIFYIAHQRQKMCRRDELGQSFALSKADRHKKGQEIRQELKTLRVLSVVVVTFIFCWAPFFSLLLIQFYKIEYIRELPKEDWQIIGSIFIVILPSFNSVCNPVIYACLDREYSNAFKVLVRKYILCKVFPRQNMQTSANSTSTHRSYLKDSANRS